MYRHRRPDRHRLYIHISLSRHRAYIRMYVNELIMNAVKIVAGERKLMK